MNRTFGWLVPLLLWGLASTALALDVPALKGRVNDRAHLLSASAAARIEDKLQKLEEDKGAQVVVLTVDSLGGGPSRSTACGWRKPGSSVVPGKTTERCSSSPKTIDRCGSRSVTGSSLCSRT